MRLWLVIVSVIVLYAVEGLGFPEGDQGLDSGELEVHMAENIDPEETIADRNSTGKNGANHFLSNLAPHDAIRGKSCPRKSKCNNGVKGKCKFQCTGKMEDAGEGCSKKGAAVECKCCIKKCKPKKKCKNMENVKGTCSRSGCKPGEKEIAKGCKGKGCSCCVEDAAAGSCPPPWFQIGNECFFGVFWDEDDPVDWHSARTKCSELADGADLAVPNDLLALEEALRAQGHESGWPYWVGGSDTETVDDYRWLNGSAMTTNWYIGHEPQFNQPNHNGVSCVQMRTGRGEFMLSDLACYHNNGYVCERY